MFMLQHIVLDIKTGMAFKRLTRFCRKWLKEGIWTKKRSSYYIRMNNPSQTMEIIEQTLEVNGRVIGGFRKKNNTFFTSNLPKELVNNDWISVWKASKSINYDVTPLALFTTVDTSLVHVRQSCSVVKAVIFTTSTETSLVHSTVKTLMPMD